MRKLLVILAFAGLSTVVAAQETVMREKHSVITNSFWKNWYVQIGADWNTWYGNYEADLDLSKSPFRSFRAAPGLSLAIGKWFTPGIGLRTKFSGFWGKAVISGNSDVNDNKYWILNEQVMLNLSNLFNGYNENRVWSVIPFFGAGTGRSCTHNEYALGVSFGLLNEFKVNNRVAVNVELGWNRYESDICAMPSDIGRGFMSHPNNIYAEVGLTFRLGRSTWSKAPDMEAARDFSQAQIDALNAMLADERADNERLRAEAGGGAEQETAAGKPRYVINAVSVFFNINEATPASDRDFVNVKAIADYAIDNNATLIVTGYADNATGSAEFNEKLSQARAEAVADRLVSMGVKKDNIRIVAKGGVSTLVPPSHNRRATVELAE